MAVQCHADGWRAVETSWSEAERHAGDLNFVWCFPCNRSSMFFIGMFHFRFLNSDKAFANGLRITVTELLPMDYNLKHLVGLQVSLSNDAGCDRGVRHAHRSECMDIDRQCIGAVISDFCLMFSMQPKLLFLHRYVSF